MTAVCEHVEMDRAAVMAAISPRLLGQVSVYCPCCGLPGYAEEDDDLTADPMPCPYCDVAAVADDRSAVLS